MFKLSFLQNYMIPILHEGVISQFIRGELYAF